MNRSLGGGQVGGAFGDDQGTLATGSIVLALTVLALALRLVKLGQGFVEMAHGAGLHRWRRANDRLRSVRRVGRIVSRVFYFVVTYISIVCRRLRLITLDYATLRWICMFERYKRYI